MYVSLMPFLAIAKSESHHTEIKNSVVVTHYNMNLCISENYRDELNVNRENS